MAFALWAAAVVAFANIAMTLALLAIYTGTYRKVKSSFTRPPPSARPAIPRRVCDPDGA